MEQIKLTRPHAARWQLAASHGFAAAAVLGGGLLFDRLNVPAWVILLLAAGLAAMLGILLTQNLRRDQQVAHLLLGHEADPMRARWLQQVEEAAAQEERNRLARDLHDSIKQQIFSMHLSAAAAEARWEEDHAGALGAVRQARSSAREAMVEMDALLLHLRPAPLETVGLIEALRQQCDTLGFRTGAEVSADFRELPPENRLPAGAQQAIFRIAQEALANIARHARASHVQVTLQPSAEALLFAVVDDGNGFDPSSTHSGMGRKNMLERVSELGGELSVKSSVGGGTAIQVSLPYICERTGSRGFASAMESALIASMIAIAILAVVGRMAPSKIAWAFLLSSPLTAMALASAVRAFREIRLTILRLTLESGARSSQVQELSRRAHELRLLIWITAFWSNPWYWGLAVYPFSPARMVYLAVFAVCGALAIVEWTGLHRNLRASGNRACIEEGWGRTLRVLGYGMPILGITVLVLTLELGQLGLLGSGLLYAAYLGVWKWRAR
jgi:signal transduction histidine kinase